ASIIISTQHKFAAAQERIRAFELRNLRAAQMPRLVHTIDSTLPVLFPDISAHLQCLNEKLRFDDAAVSGLQIEKIRSASALTPNALKHVIDTNKNVRIRAGV